MTSSKLTPFKKPSHRRHSLGPSLLLPPSRLYPRIDPHRQTQTHRLPGQLSLHGLHPLHPPHTFLWRRHLPLVLLPRHCPFDPRLCRPLRFLHVWTYPKILPRANLTPSTVRQPYFGFRLRFNFHPLISLHLGYLLPPSLLSGRAVLLSRKIRRATPPYSLGSHAIRRA